MQALAVSPRSCGSTGTRRQNMSGTPHSAQPSSNTRIAAATASGSALPSVSPASSLWGKNSMATP